MEQRNGYREQCKDWSDQCTTCIDSHVTYAAAHDWQATADLQPAAHPRLIDYAVHALWQPSLPLCNWTRAWTQVLSLDEQSRPTPHTYLCPANTGGAGAGAVGPTADGSYALRGVVRHWLRVAHAPCWQVTRSDVVGQLACGGVSNRHDRRWSVGRQYAGTCRERSSLAQTVTGGGAPCARR